VQAAVPKDKGIIIGCQKGLRSLAAAEQLSRAGYGRVAWVNGGFDTARPGDLATSNGRDIRCATPGAAAAAALVLVVLLCCVHAQEQWVCRSSGCEGGGRGRGALMGPGVEARRCVARRDGVGTGARLRARRAQRPGACRQRPLAR
jgi:hypothetical protein